MPRFNSLQELDELRQAQGSSSVRVPTPTPAPSLAPSGPPTVNPPTKVANHPAPSAMSMGQMKPSLRQMFSMPVQEWIPALRMMGEMSPTVRRLSKLPFRPFLPALTVVAAGMSVLFIWSLFAPFTSEIATWIGSNVTILILGVTMLTIAIAGYVVVLRHHVHEVLPQDILTLRADVMRRLDTFETSVHTSRESSAHLSDTSAATQEEMLVQPEERTPIQPEVQPPIESAEQPSTIQKEFEQWMQSERPTSSA